MDDERPDKRAEFTDHQRELAGIGHKAPRFFNEDDNPRSRSARERQAREQALQVRLNELLLNPEFAAAYTSAGEAIDNAQSRLTAALDRVAERIEHLTDLVREMEETTAKLPDGTAVFRDTQGRLRTAEGDVLDAARTAMLIDPDDLQSYEQYEAARDALDGARSRQDRLSGYQSRIDDARVRRGGAETAEELEQIEREMDELVRDLEIAESVAPTFGLAASGQDHDPSQDPTLKIDMAAP